MKWENGSYLFAFLCGVVLVNVLGSRALIDYNILNRYSMAMLSFGEISYEIYFVQVLLLRFQTVLILWILSKLLPVKGIMVMFGCLLSGVLGAIFAISILANGVWGIWFSVSALLPHGIFYALAYLVWRNINMGYLGNSKNNRVFTKVLMLLLIVIGSICEAYISPGFLENVINY